MTTSSIPAPSEDAANVDDTPDRQPTVLGLFWQFAHGYFFSERRWLTRHLVGTWVTPADTICSRS